MTARRKSKQAQRKQQPDDVFHFKPYAVRKAEEEERYAAEPPKYYDVKLVDDSYLKWIPDYDDDGKEIPGKKDWEHLAVMLWFPAQNQIRYVRVATCIMAFEKF